MMRSAKSRKVENVLIFADPCQTEGCSAPYNIGCRVVNNKAECICSSCPNISRPVCASDDVQDLSECHLKRQACLGDISVTVAKQSPCGEFVKICSYLYVITNKAYCSKKNIFFVREKGPERLRYICV